MHWVMLGPRQGTATRLAPPARLFTQDFFLLSSFPPFLPRRFTCPLQLGNSYKTAYVHARGRCARCRILSVCVFSEPCGFGLGTRGWVGWQEGGTAPTRLPRAQSLRSWHALPPLFSTANLVFSH